jgi:hypothetical protein
VEVRMVIYSYNQTLCCTVAARRKTWERSRSSRSTVTPSSETSGWDSAANTEKNAALLSEIAYLVRWASKGFPSLLPVSRNCTGQTWSLVHRRPLARKPGTPSRR